MNVVIFVILLMVKITRYLDSNIIPKICCRYFASSDTVYYAGG